MNYSNFGHLVGRIVRDPYVGNGVTMFTIAVNKKLSKEAQAKAEAENKPTASFIDLKAFGKIGDSVAKWFNKGDLIDLCFQLDSSNYKDEHRLECVVTDINWTTCQNKKNAKSEPANAEAVEDDAAFIELPPEFNDTDEDDEF